MREEMINLRGSFIGTNYDHVKENPFKAFEGKRILKTFWTPGGVDVEFYDGSKGYIDMMVHRDQFNGDCLRMCDKGELFVTAGIRE